MTMFNSKPRQIKFHTSSSLLFLTSEPRKHIRYMIGAVIPERISRFLPAKVISSGINLCVLSIYNVISTGTRTICTSVNFFRSMLSVNLLPLLVTSKVMIKMIGGAMTNNSLGGIVEVSWKTSFKERIPVTASQVTDTIAAVALFFTALMNSKNVRTTVSKKISKRLSGRLVSI